MEFNEELVAQYTRHMEYCISLAKRAIPNTSQGRLYRHGFISKPYVGAVVLDKDGNLIGEGYKSFLGGTSLLMHAERMALDSSTVDGRADTLITTLQPCMRKSRNQIFDSCSNLIIQKGVRRVVFGLRDDASFNYDNTVNHLHEHGVEVVELSDMSGRIKEELIDINIFQRA